MADKDWRATFEFADATNGRLYDTTFCVREHTTLVGESSLGGNTVADDLATWLGVKARAMASVNTYLERVHVNRGGPFGPGEGDDPEAGDHTVHLAGTLTEIGGNLLPHGVCCRVTVRTALASKRGRGRFHAPYPKWGAFLTDADHWNQVGAYFLAVDDFAQTLLAGHTVTHDLVDHHYSLRVHSRKDATTRDANAAITRPEVSYLRSRLTIP